MNGNPLNGILTPQIRKWLYVALALALAAVQILKVVGIDVGTADDILTVIGGLFGLTAASNVPTPDTNEPGGGNDPKPVQTDNGPTPEDGDQSNVIQDPEYIPPAEESDLSGGEATDEADLS